MATDDMFFAEVVRACVQFMVTLWRRVMTPFQAARISVTAYPIIQVDMLAVVKCAFHGPGSWCPVMPR